MAERAKKNLLRVERHENWIDTVDLHGAVAERAGAVVVAHRNGKIELCHEVTWNAKAGPHSTWSPLPIKRPLADRAERLRPHVVESDRINLHSDAAVRRIVRCEPEGEGRIARTPPIGGADWALERECYEISGLHCIG